MEADHSNLCPHCETVQITEARFCPSCGNALPTGWDEPRLFTHVEGSSLAVGFELREAVLAAEVPSGCARRFFGVILALGLLSAVSWSISLGLPVVQEFFPPILLGIVWVEVIGVFGLWVWSRTQPYAAALTGFVFFLTGAVYSFFTSLSMLEVVPLFAVIFQTVCQAGFLWVAYKVVRSSRDPLGPSKLSTPLALRPVALECAPAALVEEFAARERAIDEPSAFTTPEEEEPVDEQASRQEPMWTPAVALIDSLRRRSMVVIRSSDEWMPSWLRPFPLRVFQAVIVVVVLFELDRVVTVITGPRGRFFPFRHAILLSPIVALADAAVGVMASFGLIKGLVKLIGDSVIDRDYWLKRLPRLAVMFGGLAVLRIISIALAVVSDHVQFGSPEGGFFVILAADMLMAALCIIGLRLWKESVIPGKP